MQLLWSFRFLYELISNEIHVHTVWDAEYCARGYNPVLMYCNASKTVVSALVSHPKLISRLIERSNEIDHEHPRESRFTVSSTE